MEGAEYRRRGGELDIMRGNFNRLRFQFIFLSYNSCFFEKAQNIYLDYLEDYSPPANPDYTYAAILHFLSGEKLVVSELLKSIDRTGRSTFYDELSKIKRISRARKVKNKFLNADKTAKKEVGAIDGFI